MAARPIAARRDVMCFSPCVVLDFTIGRVVTNNASRGQRRAGASQRRKRSMPVKVHALDHLVINVSDVARSTDWYHRILGMEIRVFDPGAGKPPRTSLIFGNQKINVRPRDADKVE